MLTVTKSTHVTDVTQEKILCDEYEQILYVRKQLTGYFQMYMLENNVWKYKGVMTEAVLASDYVYTCTMFFMGSDLTINSGSGGAYGVFQNVNWAEHPLVIEPLH